MLSLTIDTSTTWGRFALAQGSETLVYQPHNVAGSYADALLTVVDDVLERGGRKLKDLDAIGICHGPGPFTGLRIACGVVQGLALGANLPVAPVSSLAAVAAQVPAAAGEARSSPPTPSMRSISHLSTRMVSP